MLNTRLGTCYRWVIPRLIDNFRHRVLLWQIDHQPLCRAVSDSSLPFQNRLYANHCIQRCLLFCSRESYQRLIVSRLLVHAGVHVNFSCSHIRNEESKFKCTAQRIHGIQIYLEGNSSEFFFFCRKIISEITVRLCI